LLKKKNKLHVLQGCCVLIKTVGYIDIVSVGKFKYSRNLPIFL